MCQLADEEYFRALKAALNKGYLTEVAREVPSGGSKVRLLDLKMFLMSPAVAMQKTNWYQKLTTIQGQQEVRNVPSCRGSSSLFWSGVAFDRWPTHRFVRVLRRAFKAIKLQACPRVIALLRRDQDRKHIPALPR